MNGSREVIMLSNNSSFLINASNIHSSVAALLFEVHTQKESLTLSQDETPLFDNSVAGKNIGIISLLKNNATEMYAWLFNFNSKNQSALLKILPLDSSGPIPGGCNMEFPTRVAPYLKLKSDNFSTVVDFQHANIGSPRDVPPPLCSSTLIYLAYDVYVLFLKENDYSETEYMTKIENMTNIEFIKQYATKVKSVLVHPDTRSVFYNYPNVGAIYNVVAKYTLNDALQETAYVPIATYGCDITSEYGCIATGSLECQIFLFLLSFFGLFVAFYGHQFFAVENFFFGFLSFTFVGFILLAKYCSFSEKVTLQITSGIGIVGGVFWTFIWLTFYIPILSLLLVGFVFGFLVTATIVQTPVGSNEVFINDENFWLILATGMLVITIAFLTFPNLLSIIASSIVGTYTLLLLYDNFLETRLVYIVLNVIKRAVSKTLSIASNDYPFQLRDVIVYSLWVSVSILAIIVQLRKHSHDVSFCIDCKKVFVAGEFRTSSNCYDRVISTDSDDSTFRVPLINDNINHNYDTFHR